METRGNIRKVNFAYGTFNLKPFFFIPELLRFSRGRRLHALSPGPGKPEEGQLPFSQARVASKRGYCMDIKYVGDVKGFWVSVLESRVGQIVITSLSFSSSTLQPLKILDYWQNLQL